jgi:hypothetical protein
MNALQLAFAFVRVSRLFRTLFLFPLVISLVLVYCQLLITGAFLSATNNDPKFIQEKIKSNHKNNFVRKFLLKTETPLTHLEICRWSSQDAEVLNKTLLHPQKPECVLEKYDVVIQTADPVGFNVSEYVPIFTGNFRRLHLCQKCYSDIVIHRKDGEISSHTYSIWGLALLSLTDFSGETIDNYFKVLDQVDRVSELTGERYLHGEGFIQAFKVSDLANTLGIVANIAFIMIIALWLSLRAHRRVLEYFADTDALLPMVAATGKNNFYGAIWLLTLLRVSAFLVCAIPFCLISLKSLTNSSLQEIFFGGDFLAFIIWLIALSASMSLAALLASIADLKHRYFLLSFTYRYVPLLLCFVGGGIWVLVFLFPFPSVEWVRDVVASLPLIGMTPILLAPVFTPKYGILVLNTLLTTSLLVIAARHNARWFAAHLEDL